MQGFWNESTGCIDGSYPKSPRPAWRPLSSTPQRLVLPNRLRFSLRCGSRPPEDESSEPSIGTLAKTSRTLSRHEGSPARATATAAVGW